MTNKSSTTPLKITSFTLMAPVSVCHHHDLTHGEERVYFILQLQSIIDRNQGRNYGEMMLTSSIPSSYSAPFDSITQAHLSRDGTTYSGLGSPTVITISNKGPE